jgi:hypothetical protein
MSGSSSAPEVSDLPFTMDDDPADRRWDRLLAYLGVIDDSAPMFRDAQTVPHAGVLLALPALLSTGVLDAAREVWGSIGPAFYGLRTSIVPLSSAHRSRAIAALCARLNATATVFPGTRLRLRYAVADQS